MWKPEIALILAAAILLPVLAAAQDLGQVTKTLRPQLRTYDDKGAPTGTLKASMLKLPAPIVGYGTGRTIGVRVKDRVVYLRGLDVQTRAAGVDCAPVQGAARPKGSAYAAANMGLGGAADCKKVK